MSALKTAIDWMSKNAGAYAKVIVSHIEQLEAENARLKAKMEAIHDMFNPFGDDDAYPLSNIEKLSHDAGRQGRRTDDT